MLIKLIKKIVRRSLNAVGLEVRRRVPAPVHPGESDERASHVGALRQARRLGLAPATVIDVGAAFGGFVRECHPIFPDARYVLVEPLEEYAAALAGTIAAVAPGAEHVRAVAARQPDAITIHVHPDLVGSSLFLENEEGDVNGVPRTVPAVTLDGLVRDRNLKGPFLLKIDAQGAELEVLSGAAVMLRDTEFVLVEVSFFAFFQDGPQFYDVVTFMKERGFVVYDICGFQYRPVDGALSQVDLVFVREAGAFRTCHTYATPEQREAQYRAMAAEPSP